MSTTYYDTIGGPPPEDHEWKVDLEHDFHDWFLMAWYEACRRLNYHEDRHTPQTSKRDELPRKLEQEWAHLNGEVALALMLGDHGVDISPHDLNWGATSQRARQRSREGNVLPGVSVYVPDGDRDLILREEEARKYPDVIFVLVHWQKRSLQARGWRRCAEGHRIGSHYGPNGQPLRAKGDKRVPRYALLDMESILQEPEVRR